MVIIHKKHKQTDEEKEVQQKKAANALLGIEDEFQAKGFELVSFVQTHKAIVWCVIGLAILGGGVGAGYRYMKNRSSEEASNAYIEAVAMLESKDGKEEEDKTIDKKAATLEALKKVSDNYKSTPVAVLSNLHAAHLALSSGKIEDSVTLFEQAVSKLKKTDNFYPLALMGLGAVYEENKQFDKSLEIFEEIIGIKDAPGGDLALFKSARLASRADQKDKAKEYLHRLRKEFPSSPYEREAKRMSESLL